MRHHVSCEERSSTAYAISYSKIRAPFGWGGNHLISIHLSDVNSDSIGRGCCGTSGGIRQGSELLLHAECPAALAMRTRTWYASPGARPANSRAALPPCRSARVSSGLDSDTHSLTTSPLSPKIWISKERNGNPLHLPANAMLKAPQLVESLESNESSSNTGCSAASGGAGAVQQSQVTRSACCPLPGPGRSDHSREPPMLLKHLAAAKTICPGRNPDNVNSVGSWPVAGSGSNSTSLPFRRLCFPGKPSSKSWAQ
mmetsp:Transcript_6977/g.20748  ORF Transcript_6977/g.20748 Transcript_6977/m.20748 type:complete len:256 (-) Transcript_6977:1911-2678(-)